MEIKLDQQSFVDQRTGEVSAPSEFLENLRGIEISIVRADDDIARLKTDLKTIRGVREELVARLRVAVREGKVLPLFEIPPEPDEDDGLEVDDGPEL